MKIKTNVKAGATDVTFEASHGCQREVQRKVQRQSHID